MSVTSDAPAPYAPAATILDVITRFRERGMASPFTRDVLERAGVSSSLVPRTLQALRTLDLIDEQGNPTEVLDRIAKASTEQYPSCLAEWLRATYADVFQFADPEKDDASRIRDAFRSYEPRGQQPRMVTLFLGLCEAAGIRPDSDSPKERIKPARRTTSPVSRRTQGRDTITITKQRHQIGGVPEPISGLLATLPESGRWTKAERDAFITTFTAVLDYCVKIDTGDS